jgi:tetratricopeptide (TPR) repeat protein
MVRSIKAGCSLLRKYWLTGVVMIILVNFGACAIAAPVADSDSNDCYHTGPGMRNLGLGPPKVTVEQLERGLRANPKSTALLVQRGNWNMIDSEYDKAIADFNKALTIDPRCARAHIGLSKVYQSLRNWPQALAELQEAGRIGPALVTVDTVFESAFVHRELCQYPQALTEYDSVLKSGLLSKNRQAIAYLQRGETYNRSGKPDMAANDLSSAIKLDPKLLPAYLARARAHRRLNQVPKAIADYSALIEGEKKGFPVSSVGGLTSYLPVAYRERAELYARTGRADLAKKDKDAGLSFEREQVDLVPFMSK